LNSDEVREQLADHLLGTLDEVTEAAVGRHLRGCAGCRADQAALEEGIATFARTHEVEPPPELRARIFGVLEREWAEPEPEPPRRWSTAFAPRRWLVPVAAALVLLLAVGWGAVQTGRAAHFEPQAAAYDRVLRVLGGSNERVGRIHATGTQDLQGSVVLYDSMVGQSWALVLVRAPGLHGEVNVTLSSGNHTIEMRSLYFTSSGEASSWLVTSADLRSFDHVTLTDATTGAVIATGTTNP
jgi:predicted anti-sigma-YlaC factor YlaD